jgi:hypothetical protein
MCKGLKVGKDFCAGITSSTDKLFLKAPIEQQGSNTESKTNDSLMTARMIYAGYFTRHSTCVGIKIRRSKKSEGSTE